MNWHDPQVVAALIGGGATLLSGIATAVIAVVVSMQIADRRRLQDNLNIAMGDIEYLLRVEEILCEKLNEAAPKSVKLKVRAAVREEGQNWSGKNTPGRRRQRSIRS